MPVTKVLHLKSGVTALPDGTVVGFPPLVDDTGAYPSFLAVPEEHGTAVVDLGVPSTAAGPCSCPPTPRAPPSCTRPGGSRS